MEESTGYNGFTPSDYAEELYRDAKVNAQRKQRLQRRLDNLAKEQQQNLKHQMKQRIFKAGIEYYEARAEYCYYLAESAYDDYSGLNVPLVAVCNVPPIAFSNVPPQKWLL